MRQVILQIDITLDGFVAGPSGETDWVTADKEMNQDAYALLGTADTILLARLCPYFAPVATAPGCEKLRSAAPIFAYRSVRRQCRKGEQAFLNV